MCIRDRNNPHYGSGAPADGMTEEEMEEWLYHAADVMGVEMEQVERYVDTTTWEGHPDEEEYAGYDGLYVLYARGGGLDISVDRNGILSISAVSYTHLISRSYPEIYARLEAMRKQGEAGKNP